ncbi:hypothetical protein [Polaromonas sp. AER18D-145]|uniref:hypothetical protein n=1 Tax=Polaromonas sp. AER18D-145 TaxID=1977060 RepID=UPI001F0AB9D7|nr:hypothetical protein [Polaromonas sp. AER18D-145]
MAIFVSFQREGVKNMGEDAVMNTRGLCVPVSTMTKSNSTFAGASLHPQTMHLPTVERSILDENTFALMRRWKAATVDPIDDPRIMNRWFPGQRELFRILSVLTKEQVVDLADCRMPLFSLRLPVVSSDGVFRKALPSSNFEAECLEEAALALVTRLDALRTSHTQGRILYDLNSAQANFFSRHSPRELYAVATDPAVGLIPASTDEFFTIAAMSKLTSRERTVLAATTRRNHPLSH